MSGFIEGRRWHANSLALALETMTGKPTTVLCVGCLERADPHETKVAKRVGGPGYCYCCPYTDGPELFIVGMTTAEAGAIEVAA